MSRPDLALKGQRADDKFLQAPEKYRSRETGPIVLHIVETK